MTTTKKRSYNETTNKPNVSPTKKTKVQYVIAMSNVDQNTRELIEDILSNEPNVELFDDEKGDCKEFTHLIVGEKKRTLKVLYACARGVPMLKPCWITGGYIKTGEFSTDTYYYTGFYENSDEFSKEVVNGEVFGGILFNRPQHFHQLSFRLYGGFNIGKNVVEDLIRFSGGAISKQDEPHDLVLFDKANIYPVDFDNLRTHHVNWLFDCVTTQEMCFEIGMWHPMLDQEKDVSEQKEEHIDEEPKEDEDILNTKLY